MILIIFNNTYGSLKMPLIIIIALLILMLSGLV